MDGQPTSALVTNERNFQPDGADGLVCAEDRAMLAREAQQPQTIVSSKHLDAPLQPVVQATPVFPFSLEGKVSEGNATVEFIVDEQGTVRLPRIVKADAPALGYAAVQASAAWKFAPPRAGGQPAAVRARVPFRFYRESPRGGSATEPKTPATK